MSDGLEIELEDAQRKPRALGALRHGAFVLFWLGLMISATGSWMQSIAQGWLVWRLTHSPLNLGLVTACATLPILLLSLHGGVIADRFNKRRIVIVTQTLAAVQAAVLAALALSHVIQVWHIMAMAAFSGFVNALDMPTRQAMTIELVGKEDLLSAVSLNSSAFNISRIAGPAIAGGILYLYSEGRAYVPVTVTMSGTGMCFLVNAISFFALIFMLVVIRPVSSKPSGREVSMFEQIREGLQYVRGNRLVLDLVLMTAIASLFILQYSTLMPVLAAGLHKGAAGFAALVSAAGFGAFTAAVSVAAFGHLVRQGKMVVMGSFLTPAGLVALALSRSYPLSIGCMVITGFGMMMFLAVSNSLIQIAPPEQLRGRVLSVRTLMFIGLAPFGALVAGGLAEYLGARVAIMIGAVIFMATTAYMISTSPALGSMDSTK